MNCFVQEIFLFNFFNLECLNYFILAIFQCLENLVGVLKGANCTVNNGKHVKLIALQFVKLMTVITLDIVYFSC